MSKVSAWVPEVTSTPPDLPAEGDTSSVKRINVAVTPETARAIRDLMTEDSVGVTEAVRRLLTYGQFVYQTAKDDRKELMVREGDNLSGVVLLR
jgi:hypothetical protein